MEQTFLSSAEFSLFVGKYRKLSCAINILKKLSSLLKPFEKMQNLRFFLLLFSFSSNIFVVILGTYVSKRRTWN